MNNLKSILLFPVLWLRETFDSWISRIPRFWAVNRSRILTWLLIAAAISWFFQPAARLYRWSEPQPGKDPALLMNFIHGSLEHSERFLLSVDSLWRGSFLTGWFAELPIINRFRFSIGLTSYHLGTADLHAWNAEVQKIFSIEVPSGLVRWNNREGWLLPELTAAADSLKEKERRELEEKTGKWSDPAQAYLNAQNRVDRDFRHGIYLTGTSARFSSLKTYLPYLRRQEMNAVVFDIKDVTGYVNYSSELPEVQRVQKGIRPPIRDLRQLAAFMRAQKLYSIARVSLFQDEKLVSVHPEYGILKKNGAPLLTGGRRVWVDANRKEVQDYNLNIIREVLASGVDEIQLDYVRYPAEGDWKDAAYHNLKNHFAKPQVISGFLQKVHALTKSRNAGLSLDVFGVVAWQEKLDIKSTGQDMRLLGQSADVISPMLYPSHFGTVFGGIVNPADSPYLFIKEGCDRIRPILPPHVKVRPWIQAFPWRVSNYNGEYVEKQVKGAYASGAFGYLLWNAGNNYPAFTPQRPPRP